MSTCRGTSRHIRTTRYKQRIFLRTAKHSTARAVLKTHSYQSRMQHRKSILQYLPQCTPCTSQTSTSTPATAHYSTLVFLCSDPPLCSCALAFLCSAPPLSPPTALGTGLCCCAGTTHQSVDWLPNPVAPDWLPGFAESGVGGDAGVLPAPPAPGVFLLVKAAAAPLEIDSPLKGAACCVDSSFDSVDISELASPPV